MSGCRSTPAAYSTAWPPDGPLSHTDPGTRPADATIMPIGIAATKRRNRLRETPSCRMRAIRKYRHVHFVGIDLAADAKTTGAVFVRGATASRSIATGATAPSTDDALVDAVRDVEAVGVDAPRGWPAAFVEAVAAHREFRPWPGNVDRSTLTHRDTDRAIRQHGIRAALSVSADKLGSVAMRCALLQRRWADEVWGRPAGRRKRPVGRDVSCSGFGGVADQLHWLQEPP